MALFVGQCVHSIYFAIFCNAISACKRKLKLLFVSIYTAAHVESITHAKKKNNKKVRRYRFEMFFVSTGIIAISQLLITERQKCGDCGTILR